MTFRVLWPKDKRTGSWSGGGGRRGLNFNSAELGTNFLGSSKALNEGFLPHRIRVGQCPVTLRPVPNPSSEKWRPAIHTPPPLRQPLPWVRQTTFLSAPGPPPPSLPRHHSAHSDFCIPCLEFSLSTSLRLNFSPPSRPSSWSSKKYLTKDLNPLALTLKPSSSCYNFHYFW